MKAMQVEVKESGFPGERIVLGPRSWMEPACESGVGKR